MHELRKVVRTFDPAFRWRGGEISRLEGFSDAVFAFALTLLVVALEVPRSFDELLAVVRGFLPFAICFAALLMVWFQHYRWFRRYGLQDMTTVVLNSCLLFVVLFYVYPLKFLFTIFIGAVLFGGRLPEGMAIHNSQIPLLFEVYGAGFAAVFGIFALLYVHAWKRRDDLALNDVERYLTRSSAIQNGLVGLVGLISMTMAVLIPPRSIGWAGWIYMLIPVLITITESVRGMRQRKLAAIQADQEE